MGALKGSLSPSFDLSPKSADLPLTMRTSLVRLGKGFGQLPLTGGVGIRGVTKYHLSPFEQKAFAGVPNFFRRVKGEFLNVVPPFVIGYLIFDYYEKEHDRLQRKQPGQFDNDV